MSPSCYGRRPRVCRHGLITHATTQGCLSGLLTADPSYDQECAWLFEPRIPRDAVYPQTTNVYTLSTNGTDLVYRCEGQLESRTTVTAGVYELTITSPCTLYGRDWYLTSTFQRTINVSLQTEEVNFTLNTTLSDLFSEDSNFEPLVNELELMDDVERKQLTFSDIEASMLKNGPTLFSKRWHGFWAVPGLAILAGVAVGLWRRLRRTLAPPGEDKIEIDIRPVCESKSDRAEVIATDMEDQKVRLGRQKFMARAENVEQSPATTTDESYLCLVQPKTGEKAFIGAMNHSRPRYSFP